MMKTAVVTVQVDLDLDAYARFYATTESRTDVRKYIGNAVERSIRESLAYLIDAGVIIAVSA